NTVYVVSDYVSRHGLCIPFIPNKVNPPSRITFREILSFKAMSCIPRFSWAMYGLICFFPTAISHAVEYAAVIPSIEIARQYLREIRLILCAVLDHHFCLLYFSFARYVVQMQINYPKDH